MRPHAQYVCSWFLRAAALTAALVTSASIADAETRDRPVSAGVPSAANSTLPSRVTAGPDGACCFDVIVRDVANNPIPGSVVAVSFGPCAVTFCPSQPAGTTIQLNTARVVTDATGTAHVCICVSTDISACSVSISADGIVLTPSLMAQTCASDSACAPDSWHAVAIGPSARRAPAMAADFNHESTLLFGGMSPAGYLGDTWKWDGLAWTRLTPSTSPPSRAQHAMAYDRQRRRMVLFGGISSGGPLGDTWEFDGANWAQVALSGPNPGPRLGHSMVYDESRGRVVLFGGSNGAALGDTWEWDGGTWTAISPSTSPAPRQGAAMAFDFASGLTLLYGGDDGSSPLGDMWAYSGGNWLQLSPDGTTPGSRTGACMAFSPEGNQVVLYGGSGPEADGSTWRWSGGHWLASSSSVGMRVQHALGYDHFNDHLLLFGGFDPTSLTGPYADLTPHEWCSPCSFVAALVDSNQNELVPDDADTTAWNDVSDTETTETPVTTLYPGTDASTVNWLDQSPCDPAFGGERDSLAYVDPWPEESDSLGISGMSEEAFRDSLDTWDTRYSAYASLPDSFPDSLATLPSPVGDTTHVHCRDPKLKYAFGGRDIVYVHGLELTPLKDRMWGLNDSSEVDWRPTHGQPGYTVNPDFYGDGNHQYFKGNAVRYWYPHIKRFLIDKGYANRYIIVSWPTTQRMRIGMNAMLCQIADAMRDGFGVTDLSGKNDTQGFGAKGFVVVSHSTGGAVSDAALASTVFSPDPSARYIASHVKAHIAFEGAMSGSRIATLGLGVSAVLSVTPFPGYCSLLQDLFGDHEHLCDNVVNWSSPLSSVLVDLVPSVMQLRWGLTYGLMPCRTLTVTGGHPSARFYFKRHILPGFDDGVVNTNSASGNDNSSSMWPSGYLRLGPYGTASQAVYDPGINDKNPLRRRRAEQYSLDQSFDPLVASPQSRLFSIAAWPFLTRFASGCTDKLSPTGMRQPWHFKPFGGPIDPNSRYPKHFSFVESTASHYGFTPDMTDDPWWAATNEYDSTYVLTFQGGKHQHNTEEVLAINDEGIYDSYGPSWDPYPLLDKTNSAVMNGISTVEFTKTSCHPKRKNKTCKIVRWKRTYDRLLGWQSKLAADYVYDYVLTQAPDTCHTTTSVAPGRLVFFARNGQNPFRRQLDIEFQLPVASDVMIEVYDMMGRRVRSLVNHHFESGRHAVIWDGRNADGSSVRPGVYFWRMRLDGSSQVTSKAILLQ